MMSIYNIARKNFKAKDDQVTHFEAKVYPGGAAKQRKEVRGVGTALPEVHKHGDNTQQQLGNLMNV
jgi:hypothetical protein